ncbi:hypothetical protein QE197_20635 (plasmid) [Arsenophonus nasoniae]|uniref:Uncharacterized protein n=1 Tax=Arsenophonus nasoniae TaxID=638 RepID=A0A4P7KZG4_9GAMM|nr:hypothetical protein [Arsenophonus nasoniae]QBY45787.1 hypothetical protein ArsFIN_43980 [Arsenophonus nasoniae]WGM08037.1 hypothetical protein QE258_21060 [Arsenophonus nasoniae]WGM12822.1 hypothetical protein QE197_20635 [Arsenophonus nasoniae]WGM17530.1 hypothetical protein QE193_19305 [Arsenophonus nasoniae]
MLIKCIFNKGKNIPLEYRCLYETDETDYSYLKIGDKFRVYGIKFFPTRVDYLICNHYGNRNPDWIPGNLFEVIDHTLPNNWSICITYLNQDFKPLYDSFKIHSIISYPKLVTSISHYEGIIEREYDDLLYFFLEKEKFDNRCEYQSES